MPTKHSAVTVIQKLERSKLDPKTIQQELMGDDLDLDKLVVYLQSKVKFEAAKRVLDINISRTIEGASTVAISLNDYERTILNSGVLNNALDIQLNGLWFRLVKVERQAGDTTLTLTFEDRGIAILRSYPKTGAPHNGVKFAHRSKTTRAEFILNLIREVKEFHIPVVIPELHKIQPIERSADLSMSGRGTGGVTTDTGIAKNTNKIDSNVVVGSPRRILTLTVKGANATPEQITNANTIIAVGKSMGARRKVIVCAIMTAIVESTIHNLPGGDLDSVGIFQQRDNWGSYADRHDPATASRLFYKQAISTDVSEPNAPYWQLCADVQHPLESLRTRYGDYRVEAERFVTAAGMPGGDSEANVADVNLMDRSTWGTGQVADYVFYRGTPKEGGKVWTRENNWDCIQRLASEVQWRAFFVSGVFYLLPEDDLFKTQPIMILDETSQGVEGIGFDYDIGKKAATVSIPVRVGTWLAPPGAVVALQHCGPVSGRWIVSDFSRSLFDSRADVSLKKPMPVLPEPLKSDLASIPTWAVDSGKTVAGGFDTSGESAASLAGKLVSLKGKSWFDDNGRGTDQLFKVSTGRKLVGAEGPVDLDKRTIEIILWLISNGYKIGTYAWCEDHHDDGQRGHAGGHAVDISSINGIAISSESAGKVTLEVATLLHGIVGDLTPRQLICGGYGNHFDIQIEQNTIPSPGYYGNETMQQHTNHIHVGY